MVMAYGKSIIHCLWAAAATAGGGREKEKENEQWGPLGPWMSANPSVPEVSRFGCIDKCQIALWVN